MIKKITLLSTFTLLFSACSSDISDEVLKKYENALNQSVQNELKQYNKDFKIDIKNFTCKADSAYIECNSPDFSLSSEKAKLFSVKNIKLRSNEIYAENNASSPISYKDYYTYLFSKNDKLETTLNLDGLQLSDESIKQIENDSKSLMDDEKIAKFIQELSKDSYNLTAELFTSKKDANLNYNYSYKISNNKENFIALNLNGSLKDEFFNILDTLNIKFDTSKLAFDAEKFLGNSSKNTEAFLNNASLKNFNLDINLQTNNAFAPYINMAKSSLEILKNQNNEEQDALFSQAFELIDEMSQNPLYKLKLALDFKDISLSQFSTLKESGVEKITINGKDFSPLLKAVSQLSQMEMMYP